MGLFGKSFEEKVKEAVAKVGGMGLGVRNLGAKIEGKVVTLTGDVPRREVSVQVMENFDKLVKTDNTLNAMRVDAPKPAPAPAPPHRLPSRSSGSTRSWPASRSARSRSSTTATATST